MGVEGAQHSLRNGVLSSLCNLKDSRPIGVGCLCGSRGTVRGEQHVPDGEVGTRQGGGLVQGRVAGDVGGSVVVRPRGDECQQRGYVVDGVGTDGFVERSLGQ